MSTFNSLVGGASSYASLITSPATTVIDRAPTLNYYGRGRNRKLYPIGDILYCDNFPVRTVGVVDYTTLRYLQLQSATNYLEELRRMADYGIKFVKTPTGAISAKELSDTYFKDEAGKRKYLENIKRYLDWANHWGIGVVLTLLWDYQAIPDMVSENISTAYGVTGAIPTNSQTYVKANDFITTIVTTFKDHPSLSGWEMGQEYNDVWELQKLPEVDVDNKGTRAEYSSSLDTLTKAAGITFTKWVGERIRTADPSDRIIMTGHNLGSRVGALEGLIETEIDLINPEPYNTLSFSKYTAGIGNRTSDDTKSIYTHLRMATRHTFETTGRSMPLVIRETGATLMQYSASQFIKYDSAGANPSPATTQINAISRGTTLNSVYYEFLVNGTIVQNSVSPIYIHTANSTYNSTPTLIKVNIREGSSSASIKATDTMSIVSLKPGVITGFLTNEQYTAPANSSGGVSSFSNAGGTFRVFDGITEKTSSSTYSLGTSTGVSTSILSNTGVYSISSMSADTGTATFNATYSGNTISKTYTIYRSKLGSTSGTGGIDGRTVELIIPSLYNYNGIYSTESFRRHVEGLIDTGVQLAFVWGWNNKDYLTPLADSNFYPGNGYYPIQTLPDGYTDKANILTKTIERMRIEPQAYINPFNLEVDVPYPLNQKGMVNLASDNENRVMVCKNMTGSPDAAADAHLNGQGMTLDAWVYVDELPVGQEGILIQRLMWAQAGFGTSNAYLGAGYTVKVTQEGKLTFEIAMHNFANTIHFIYSPPIDCCPTVSMSNKKWNHIVLQFVYNPAARDYGVQFAWNGVVIFKENKITGNRGNIYPKWKWEYDNILSRPATSSYPTLLTIFGGVMVSAYNSGTVTTPILKPIKGGIANLRFMTRSISDEEMRLIYVSGITPRRAMDAAKGAVTDEWGGTIYYADDADANNIYPTKTLFTFNNTYSSDSVSYNNAGGRFIFAPVETLVNNVLTPYCTSAPFADVVQRTYWKDRHLRAKGI